MGYPKRYIFIGCFLTVYCIF